MVVIGPGVSTHLDRRAAVLVRLDRPGWQTCSLKEEVFDRGGVAASGRGDLLEAAGVPATLRRLQEKYRTAR